MRLMRRLWNALLDLLLGVDDPSKPPGIYLGDHLLVKGVDRDDRDVRKLQQPDRQTRNADDLE